MDMCDGCLNEVNGVSVSVGGFVYCRECAAQIYENDIKPIWA